MKNQETRKKSAKKAKRWVGNFTISRLGKVSSTSKQLVIAWHICCFFSSGWEQCMQQVTEIQGEHLKRLDRAVAHVQSLWMPCIPEVVLKIQAGFDEGRYDLSLQFLLDDLKLDIALYLYCLKELGNLMQSEDEDFEYSTPLALFDRVGITRLRSILSKHPSSISRHPSRGITRTQSHRIDAMLIGASTAELLAEKAGEDSGSAHLTALLRQLGLTLIAWNYPLLFERAFKEQNQSNTLEAILSNTLGFSPLLLAAKLIEEWGLSREIRFLATGSHGLRADEKADIATIAESTKELSHLCEIGETLARANDPEHYPDARSDWIVARTELEKHLGTNALSLLNARLDELSDGYRTLAPQQYSERRRLNPELHIHQHEVRSLIAHQPRFQALAPELQRKLKEFYAHLSSGLETKELLNFLVKQVIPLTGFSGGCVFTLDPQLQELVPRLKIGTMRLRSLQAVPIGSVSRHQDEVVTAFHCAVPLTGCHDHDKEAGAYIVSRLGDNQKVGVLYLELPDQLLSESTSTALSSFKALLKAFKDCLRVS